MPRRQKTWQIAGMKGYRSAKGYRMFKVRQAVKNKTLKIRRLI